MSLFRAGASASRSAARCQPRDDFAALRFEFGVFWRLSLQVVVGRGLTFCEIFDLPPQEMGDTATGEAIFGGRWSSSNSDSVQSYRYSYFKFCDCYLI